MGLIINIYKGNKIPISKYYAEDKIIWITKKLMPC